MTNPVQGPEASQKPTSEKTEKARFLDRVQELATKASSREQFGSMLVSEGKAFLSEKMKSFASVAFKAIGGLAEFALKARDPKQLRENAKAAVKEYFKEVRDSIREKRDEFQAKLEIARTEREINNIDTKAARQFTKAKHLIMNARTSLQPSSYRELLEVLKKSNSEFGDLLAAAKADKKLDPEEKKELHAILDTLVELTGKEIKAVQIRDQISREAVAAEARKEKLRYELEALEHKTTALGELEQKQAGVIADRKAAILQPLESLKSRKGKEQEIADSEDAPTVELKPA